MPADEGKESVESMLVDIQKKIVDAFDIFDHESNKTVDVREVGTIIRSLGLCPSEAELQDMLSEVEEEEPTGYIRLEKFLPMMTKTLMERRYRPSPEDQLLKAFQVLDAEGKGYLSQEELTKYMSEEGEGLVFDVKMVREGLPQPGGAHQIHVRGGRGPSVGHGEGEPFNQEELDEMLSAAVDPGKGTILYKDYVSLMTVDS